MKRIVWIAVTILIMIAILGFGLHTLTRIGEVNQERREKEEGEEFAAKIVVTTETTSIWEKVRANQETTSETGSTELTTGESNQMIIPDQTDENGQQMEPPEQIAPTDVQENSENTDPPAETPPAETVIVVVP